jgi:hypothetical protein
MKTETAGTKSGRLHHLCFYLENWSGIGNAADIITRHNVALDIGPNRVVDIGIH